MNKAIEPKALVILLAIASLLTTLLVVLAVIYIPFPFLILLGSAALLGGMVLRKRFSKVPDVSPGRGSSMTADQIRSPGGQQVQGQKAAKGQKQQQTGQQAEPEAEMPGSDADGSSSDAKVTPP